MSGQPERALEVALGVRFRDRLLLRLALTHSSFVHERPEEAPESNERLEFLGDAFLGLVIAEELYKRFPEHPEGRLTEMRSRLVRTETLAQLSAHLRIGDRLYLGHGEEQSGGRSRERNLARALEAVLGALLLDRGFARARKATLALFRDLLGPLPAEASRDYKSLLQEEVQALGKPSPSYQVVGQEGPDHTRRFTVEVVVEGASLAVGAGATKRRAEQEAAKAAYARLAGDVAP